MTENSGLCSLYDIGSILEQWGGKPGYILTSVKLLCWRIPGNIVNLPVNFSEKRAVSVTHSPSTLLVSFRLDSELSSLKLGLLRQLMTDMSE